METRAIPAYRGQAMTAKKKAMSNEEQVGFAVDAASALLEQKGVVPASKLGPTKLRSIVVEALVSDGYEKAGKGVRVPLLVQGNRLMADGQHIPLASLRRRLSGATAKEATELGYQLSRDGKAHLVLRGKQWSLVPVSERVVGGMELKALTDDLKGLLTWLNRARANRTGAVVLESDLREALVEASRTAFGAVRAKKGGEQPSSNGQPALQRAPTSQIRESLRDALRGAILMLRDEDSALARVPEVSRHLRQRASAQAVVEALLAASRDGELELRPEGGIGRLRAEDAALCPEGAGGARLSWVRLQEDRS